LEACKSAIFCLAGKIVRNILTTALVVAAVSMCLTAEASIVAGGGSKKTDCITVFDVPGANKPPLPKTPKHVVCDDGDASCDSDGLRNGECVFDISLCANDTSLEKCTPLEVESILIDHSADDGDPRFDVDWQALQSRANTLGFPNDFTDDCTTSSAVTVRLKGPLSNQKMKKQRKRMRVVSIGEVGVGDVKDKDKIKFVCKPEGDAIYSPRDLFGGTFDRIAQQVFAQSCALSACHDSESQAGALILLPNSAHGNIVGVAPSNSSAAGDGLERILAGDPTLSFLYRKITGDLELGYGAKMPLTGSDVSPELVEIVRLWILGDGTTGPASATGWVDGTDQ
jgi:hypothetical protein